MLGYAWNVGVFTSGDALPATGLTRSTTIDAIEALIGTGLLRELPNARAVGEYRKGRPSRRFELSADAAVVVGMDAGRGHLTTTLADLRGEPLVSDSVDLDPARDSGRARRSAVVAALRKALQAAGRSREDILAICVGVPAPVGADGVSPPPHRDDFWQRMNPNLTELLAEWAPIVRVENDASLAAVAEGFRGAAVGCRDYVTLLAGERLGTGVVIDGRLLRGAHGGAGEAVGFDHVTGVMSADGIDHRIVEWARRDVAAGDLPAGHALRDRAADSITVTTVIELARAGDEWADGLVERAGPVLAQVTAVLASFFDPARIIVSGAVPSAFPRLMASVTESVDHQLDMPTPQILVSQLGAEVVTIGAVSAAVEAARAGVLRIRS